MTAHRAMPRGFDGAERPPVTGYRHDDPIYVDVVFANSDRMKVVFARSLEDGTVRKLHHFEADGVRYMPRQEPDWDVMED